MFVQGQSMIVYIPRASECSKYVQRKRARRIVGWNVYGELEACKRGRDVGRSGKSRG